MKKVILSIALVLIFGLVANAQKAGGKDDFFTDWKDLDNGLEEQIDDLPNPYGLPVLPGGHGDSGDSPAPLGSGLLILTALGGAYAITRKNK